VKERMAAQGFSPRPMTADAFRQFIREETVKFSNLIKANNLTID
jgi:tripartite-type tricarboxylate transporter receptor subunit TctC